MLNFESQMRRARIVLESRGKPAKEFLNPDIYESWKRCIDMGLDPLSQPEQTLISNDELHEIKAENEAISYLAEGELTNLYQQISGSHFAILFANKDGVILNSVCDDSFANTANARFLVPGSEWRESAHGTNALGCVLASQRPITVHAEEHFFRSYDKLTCVASPVFGPEGELVGVLDASSDCRERQQHTHALIKMSCISIENGLFKNKLKDHVVLEMHNRHEFLGTLHVGLMAFDLNGHFISANRMAYGLFNDRIIKKGIHFDEIFRHRFRDMLDSHKTCSRMFLRDVHGSTFAVNVSMPSKRSFLSSSKSVVKDQEAETPDYIFSDPVIESVVEDVKNALKYKVPIHIHGETGTGKEVLARHIHKLSGSTGKFIAVNCANLNDSLAESELFGYQSGAFTGADRKGSQGLILQADGGTLFLDEIGDMPQSLQTTLLRFLDDWCVRPVGGTSEKKVSLNLVTATNVNLMTAVHNKTFREDLWYRINTWEVAIPPLRERTDIAEIVKSISGTFDQPLDFAKGALELLSTLPWPGNIRQLKSFLLKLRIRVHSGNVTTGHIYEQLGTVHGDVRTEKTSLLLDDHKRKAALTSFRKHNGNISAVARELGISRNTVYKLVEDS